MLSLFAPRRPRPTLLVLPNELLLHVSAHLGARDLAALLATSRLCAALLAPPLHRRAATSTLSHGRSILHWAAARGSAALVARLLAAGCAPLADRADANGTTPLLTAVLLGTHRPGHEHLEVARLLVAAGAAPDRPLCFAVIAGYVPMARLLLAAGADPRGVRYEFMVTCARRSGDGAMVAMLRAHRAGAGEDARAGAGEGAYVELRRRYGDLEGEYLELGRRYGYRECAILMEQVNLRRLVGTSLGWLQFKVGFWMLKMTGMGASTKLPWDD